MRQKNVACTKQKKLQPIAPKPPPLIYYINKGSKMCALINESNSNRKAVDVSGQSMQGNTENNVNLSPEVVDKLCRLCLEEKDTMWSFFSVLTFDDGTTIDVSNVFQSLTGEYKEQIKHPKLPPYICEPCLGLLSSANTFQQKYEESTKILNKYLFRESEENVVEKIKVIEDQSHLLEETENRQNVSDSKLHGFEFISTEEIILSEIKNISPEVDNGKKSVGIEKITNEALPQETITLAMNEECLTNSDNNVIKVKLHRCPICPQSFTALELKRHCTTHKALKTYLKAAPTYNKKVKFYAKTRTENKGLFNQEKIMHSCPFCHDEFDSEMFRDHIKQHRTEGNFRCNACNRIFLGINHLKMHQLSHKKEAPFKCKFCKKTFFLKRNYDFHLSTHSNNKELPFSCQHCNRTFSNPEHLKRHNFIHKNYMPYHRFYKRALLYVKCNQCLQKFKTEEERAVHSCRTCCAKCHKLFDSKSRFNSHVCKSKLKISQCKPCGKVFQLPSSLKTHKFRCKKRTLCYVCGKSVRNITQHLSTHYPNKRANAVFKCASCNKQFACKAGLIRHINEVHSNIVPFQCQFCSKGFKSKWNLDVHERIHHDIRAHVCYICHKGFLEKSYLKKHIRVHLRREGLVDLSNVK